MSSLLKYIIVLIAATISMSVTAASLVINEVMQSNVNTLFYEHEFPDSWVELYNPSDEPVSLRGYSLGLDGAASGAFIFTVDSVIAPGNRIIIYCDKENDGLHTDFRIDAGKGDVCLFYYNVVTDKITLKKQPAPDVAYGRRTDGSNDWGYQIYPTPGMANAGVVASEELLPAPRVYPMSAILDAPVELTIDWPAGFEPDAQTKLCVTFDGREPQLSDAIPTLPLRLEVDSNLIVKARILSPHRLSPAADGYSYIFRQRSTQLSIISLIVDPDHLFGLEEGIMTDGADPSQYDVYHYNKWRRPMHIEMFAGAGHQKIFSQLGEGRVYGTLSRDQKQKSICIYANKRFGTKRFNTAGVWGAKPTVTEVKSMIIRNAGQDTYTRMADAYAQALAGHAWTELEWEDNHPVVLYINGEYWGHYNLRERSDEDWFESNRGTEKVEIVENFDDVVTGDIHDAEEFRKIICTDGASYKDIEQLIDVDNWLHVLAYNMYGNNVDFPTNNLRMWKPLAVGGRWRLMLKDMDLWFGRWTYGFDSYFDFIESWLDPDNRYGYVPHVNIFKILMHDPEIAPRFRDRLTFLCGDVATPENALALYHKMLNRIKEEYEPTIRFNYTQEEADYLLSVIDYQRYTRFTGFLVNRPLAIATQVSSKYNLGAPCRVIFDHTDVDASFNGIPLVNPVYDGYYYCNSTLEVGLDVKYAVTAKAITPDGKVDLEVIGGTNVVIPANAESVTLTLKMRDDFVTTCAGDVDRCEYFNLQGVKVGKPIPGEIYILRDSRGSRLIKTCE